MADTRIFDEMGNVISGTVDDSPNIEKKTTAKIVSAPPVDDPLARASKTVVQANSNNVLNTYRSFTYNFTLAGLKKEYVSDPTKYRNSTLELVILKSGGKGTTGISENVSAVERFITQPKETIVAGTPSNISSSTSQLAYDDYSGLDLVKKFNQQSPGRFDMFIDNVEIESLMSFSEASGTSLPTNIKFDIIEPYSINGFIESLQTTAVAAGYTDYAQASFILKVDFVGYSDNDNQSLKSSNLIPRSSRYFVFGFTGLEVDVSERGTRYKCAAIPYNDKVFGQPNDLKRPITMAGTTVKDILENFVNNLNKQVAEDDKNSKTGKSATIHDEYRVKFPTKSANGALNFNTTNDIGTSKLTEVLKDKALYKFEDAGTTSKPNATKADDKKQPTSQEQSKEPESIKYNPAASGKSQIQFAENQRINNIISAVIRDSEYIRNKLKTISDSKSIDEYGFFEYFMVKTEIENKSEIDPTTRKHYQIYTYVILPYKIHYTRIPGYASEKFDASKIKKLSLREYNYLYTGKNIDVLGFKLNFNSLFFEAMPSAMANNDKPGGKDSAGKENTVVAKSKGSDTDNEKASQNSSGRQLVDSRPNMVQPSSGSGGQIQDDPYSTMARNMHNAVLNSVSMLTGNLEILGDPFFLVTGGIGNYNPKTVAPGKTEDDEADHINGEVLITINFRNPVDINSLEKGGMLQFDNNKLPFSGVYSILKVISTFNDGTFKQRLEVLRIPGQIVETQVKPTNVKDRLETTPKPTDQQVPTTTSGTGAESRPTELNLLAQLGRGLPSPGLPGILSNFTAALGGLGGSASSLLNQVSGAVTSGIGQLTSAAAVFGGSIPGGVNQLASGIRLQASGIVNLAQTTLGSAALINQASNTLQGAFSITDPAKAISSAISDKTTAITNLISNPGSGIGEGASILISKTSSIASTINGTTAVTDLLSPVVKLPVNITQFSGSAQSLTNSAISAVSNLNAASLVSGIGDKITSLTAGIPTDPTALASKFGINASQISGLSSDLQSKVLSQAADLAKQIPTDTDLSAATARGLNLTYVSASQLENLPATAPDTSAFASAIPASIIPNGIPNSVDMNSLKDKLSSVGSQISEVTGIAGSVESKLASLNTAVGDPLKTASNLSTSVTSQFGSVSAAASPLTKLITG